MKENLTIYDIFYILFKVSYFDVLFDNYKPLFGYEHTYSYRNIKIFVSDTRSEMGIHIYLTGSACRDLEDMNISYTDLFNRLFTLNVQFTRLDVSFDSFTRNYWTLEKISNCIKKQEVIGKFRSSVSFVKEDLVSQDNIGNTIWFGSRASDIQFVFYDKLKERLCNKVIVNDNVDFWQRFEMRFRNDKAYAIVVNYLYASNFNDYLFGIIDNYLSFRITNYSDSNRRRWKYRNWWQDFLGVVDKIRFQSKPLEFSITRKRSWLDSTCSFSAFCVLLSDIDNLSSDEMLSRFLYEFFKKGSDKITEKELQLINHYRIKNNLIPIEYEDVKDYISEVKGILIKK